MNTFKSIPIKVELPQSSDDNTVARSVLREVHRLAEAFLASGQPGFIDLRQVDLIGPSDYQFLKRTLSVGEVSAWISGTGNSEIHETTYPGIWWITHRNQKEEVVTEVIEVTDVPEILRSHRADILCGLKRLAGHLTDLFAAERESVPHNTVQSIERRA